MKSQNHKGKVITEESFAHDSSFEAKDSKNVREFKESKLIDDFYNIATEAYLRTISKSKNMKERKEYVNPFYLDN